MSGLFTYKGFSLSETPSLHGKVAVITGGQAGIGQEITAQLLRHGISKVYVLARRKQKFEEARSVWAETQALTPEELDRRTEFLQCDLSDIRDVKKVAGQLLSKLERLDILINNAALALTPNYTRSAQGIDAVFATNHVGHFVLTNILLPLLEITASSSANPKATSTRIVTTTSSVHLGCQAIDLPSLTSSTRPKSPATLDSLYRYARSKLANILFTRQLARRLEKKGVSNVYANCFFPGNIATEATDSWKDLFGAWGGGAIKGLLQLIGQSETDAAATAMFLAASEEVERGPGLKGKYFIPIATEDKTSKVAEDGDLARNLWYWTDHKVEEVLGKGWETDGGGNTAEATDGST
ncbi:MAG: hypothetical protein M1837_002336 [Sclerophora amabilis]|nr:MAG: hypothetical protein M1837_002336 [Sclerophora amabilis]